MEIKLVKNIFTLPNILSFSRIMLSPVIFFIKDNKYILFSILIIIGLTDILDGYFARKNKNETAIGARLDSISDLVFYNILVIYAILYEFDTINELKWYILIIILIKMVILIVGYIKHRKYSLLHTIGNKISGIMIFIGFCLFILSRNTIILNLGVIFSIISTLEELIITILMKKCNDNIKGIWEIRNKESIVL